MWPYNTQELAFINCGAGFNKPKGKRKMTNINTITEQYKKTVTTFTNYIPNTDARDIVNKIVDVQVDLAMYVNKITTDAFKTLVPSK